MHDRAIYVLAYEMYLQYFRTKKIVPYCLKENVDESF